MKHFYLWMIFPTLCCCTPDEEVITTIQIGQLQSKVMINYPENKANAFDDAGKLHNELCLAYEFSPTSILTIDEAVSATNTLSLSNQQLSSLTPGAYGPISKERLSFIFQNGQNPWQVIEQSPLSFKGKISLTNFVSVIEHYKALEKPYDEFYNFIISYESSVLQDVTLAYSDKQILLTTASIARYAHYFASLRKKKPPRDKDWDANVGSIIAGTEGSQESIVSAIRMSVAGSLYSNK